MTRQEQFKAELFDLLRRYSVEPKPIERPKTFWAKL